MHYMNNDVILDLDFGGHMVLILVNRIKECIMDYVTLS